MATAAGETLTTDEQRLAEARIQAGAQARLERLLQLRDLVLDHLDPGRAVSRPYGQA